MNKKLALFVAFLCMTNTLLSQDHFDTLLDELQISREVISGDLILDMKNISIPGYPGSFNPGLIATDQGLLLSFRYQPLPITNPAVSNIYVVFLDEDLSFKGTPQLLNTRVFYTKVPSQSEDARLFYFQNELWVIYNDNVEVMWGTAPIVRRDMYIAKIHCSNESFFLSCPIKLIHSEKWTSEYVQKNWVPFEWQGNLLISYSINPHDVLSVDLSTGLCEPLCETEHDIQWNFGKLRGGTPAVLLDDEYFAIFHSSKTMATPYSFGRSIYHYFMGAYTFSKNPPFEMTAISKLPIMNKTLYGPSSCGKKVVFPGGIVIKDKKVYLALGRDDTEIWIITLDKDKLKESMQPL